MRPYDTPRFGLTMLGMAVVVILGLGLCVGLIALGVALFSLH